MEEPKTDATPIEQTENPAGKLSLFSLKRSENIGESIGNLPETFLSLSVEGQFQGEGDEMGQFAGRHSP